jgi:hypothetical protein
MGVTAKNWFAFLGAALAWSLQLIIGYAVLAHACYPRGEPLDFAAQYGARTEAAIVTVITLVIAVAALVLAWRLVTFTIGRPMGYDEAVAVSGENGVPRYLAVAGVLIGIVFTLAVVFNGLAIILEPTCRFS